MDGISAKLVEDLVLAHLNSNSRKRVFCFDWEVELCRRISEASTKRQFNGISIQ